MIKLKVGFVVLVRGEKAVGRLGRVENTLGGISYIKSWPRTEAIEKI